MSKTPAASDAAVIQLVDGATLVCSGPWVVNNIVLLQRQFETLTLPDEQPLSLDGAAITAMDTAGAWQVNRLRQFLQNAGRQVILKAFDDRHAALLELVDVAEVASVTAAGKRPVRRLLFRCSSVVEDLTAFLAFVGETVLALLRVLRHPGRIRWQAIVDEVLDAGYKALPIIGLLSFLMGVVIAYQGAVQLRLYGANIYVADLVGYSMLRELAPLLAAILVSGRTGSAYTAQIGTMQVTEEVAALRTIGIPPMEILVLPKLIALIIVMPLLSVFADVMAVGGGMLMAHLQLGIGYHAFLIRLGEAINLSTFMIGIGKAPVFAAIIAIVGCYQGFKVQGSAGSVGRHTTISVVQSIFLVIVTDALFSILFSMLGV